MTIETFVKQHIPGYEKGEFVLPFDVERKTIGADQVITDYTQVEDKMLLLGNGIIQISTMKGAGERILEFAFPGEFFSAYTSFLLQQPSDVQVVALTKCTVNIIRRESLLQANRVSLLASHLSLHIAENLFLSRARREKDLLTLSAEQRYMTLLEKDPEIIMLIPGNKIARYLGIEPESLSRIRKSIIP